MQSIQLERGLRIIDSPGVVFDDDDFDDGKGNKKGNILLRNVVKVEDIEDPIAVGGYMRIVFNSEHGDISMQSRKFWFERPESVCKSSIISLNSQQLWSFSQCWL